MDKWVTHLSGLPHLPGVPHLHVNRPSINGTERFDCILYGNFLALDFEVPFNSEAKFYHIKHVIAGVKHPVGRNRLDIEAKLARCIDNHTPTFGFCIPDSRYMSNKECEARNEHCRTTPQKVRKTNWENHWSSKRS